MMDNSDGIWTKKPKPVSNVVASEIVSYSNEAITFEIDPNSLRKILTDINPHMPNEDIKPSRVTIGGSLPHQNQITVKYVSTPSDFQNVDNLSQQVQSSTSQVSNRRASLYGGAMRVRAPSHNQEKKSLRTPGRTAPRKPITQSKTPSKRHLSKSSAATPTPAQRPESVSSSNKSVSRRDDLEAEFLKCPDFLEIVSSNSSKVPASQPMVNQSPIKSRLSASLPNSTTSDLTLQPTVVSSSKTLSKFPNHSIADFPQSTKLDKPESTRFVPSGSSRELEPSFPQSNDKVLISTEALQSNIAIYEPPISCDDWLNPSEVPTPLSATASLQQSHLHETMPSPQKRTVMNSHGPVVPKPMVVKRVELPDKLLSSSCIIPHSTVLSSHVKIDRHHSAPIDLTVLPFPPTPKHAAQTHPSDISNPLNPPEYQIEKDGIVMRMHRITAEKRLLRLQFMQQMQILEEEEERLFRRYETISELSTCNI